MCVCPHVRIMFQCLAADSSSSLFRGFFSGTVGVLRGGMRVVAQPLLVVNTITPQTLSANIDTTVNITGNYFQSGTQCSCTSTRTCTRTHMHRCHIQLRTDCAHRAMDRFFGLFSQLFRSFVGATTSMTCNSISTGAFKGTWAGTVRKFFVSTFLRDLCHCVAFML